MMRGRQKFLRESTNHKREILTIWTLLKTTNLWSSKGIVKKINSQITEWEKIFTIHIFGKKKIQSTSTT